MLEEAAAQGLLDSVMGWSGSARACSGGLRLRGVEKSARRRQQFRPAGIEQASTKPSAQTSVRKSGAGFISVGPMDLVDETLPPAAIAGSRRDTTMPWFYCAGRSRSEHGHTDSEEEQVLGRRGQARARTPQSRGGDSRDSHRPHQPRRCRG